MARISDLTVNVGISISFETVQRCLDLLSIYLADNPDREVYTYEWHDYDGVTKKVGIRPIEAAEEKDV